MKLLGVGLLSGAIFVAALGGLLTSSCKHADPPVPSVPPAGVETDPPSPQRPGDPATGYQELVNAPYVDCGIPASLIDGRDLSIALPILGFPPEVVTAPNRDPKNQALPYFLTRVTNKNGVDLISTNCLSCHANVFQGNLVIGLGNANIDTTGDIAEFVSFIGSQITSPTDVAAYAPFRDRMTTLSPHVKIDTMGLTAADNLAIELFGRRDPTTLEWKGDYQIQVPQDVFAVPVAAPPWWRMRKQNGMFSTGSFRGDHTRFMFAASSLCIDNQSDSMAIDQYFSNVRAYIASLTPPKFPKPINIDLAMAGERVFIENCSGCHGRYSSLDAGNTDFYPNLIVPVEAVGTDPALYHLADEFVDAVEPWIEKTYFAPTNSFVKTKGYLAPPLDGIWITAPYLHNDSVPDLETLLDSSKRPKYFTRSWISDDFDFDKVGYAYKVETTGKVDGDTSLANRQKYDTTRPGYSNEGHLYGDVLTEDERRAVIEYLKTL